MSLPKIGETKTVSTYITRKEIKKELEDDSIDFALYPTTIAGIILAIAKVNAASLLPFAIAGALSFSDKQKLKALIRNNPDAKKFKVTQKYEWNVDPIMGYEDAPQWFPVGRTKYEAIY